MIAILSYYPIGKKLNEGMAQRISAIDSLFKSYERTYLDLSPRKFIRFTGSSPKNDVKYYQANIFTSFRRIFQILSSAEFIYIHSLYNAIWLIPFLFLGISKKKIVLDVHGIVPEEEIFNKKTIKGKMLNVIERFLFQHITNCIVVTDAMKHFYMKKYPSYNPVYLVYPIVPSHIIRADAPVMTLCENELVNVIYSGNLQSWQNIDLMLDTIKNNSYSHLRYVIMTGDVAGMREKMRLCRLVETNNIQVINVKPEELAEHYKKASYGFILRDDINVNKVACPTKLIEYMFYGITPIVLSADIGDFNTLGYDFLNLKDFANIKSSKKSSKNHSIIKGMMTQHNLNSIFN